MMSNHATHAKFEKIAMCRIGTKCAFPNCTYAHELYEIELIPCHHGSFCNYRAGSDEWTPYCCRFGHPDDIPSNKPLQQQAQINARNYVHAAQADRIAAQKAENDIIIALKRAVDKAKRIAEKRKIAEIAAAEEQKIAAAEEQKIAADDARKNANKKKKEAAKKAKAAHKASEAANELAAKNAMIAREKKDRKDENDAIIAAAALEKKRIADASVPVCEMSFANGVAKMVAEATSNQRTLWPSNVGCGIIGKPSKQFGVSSMIAEITSKMLTAASDAERKDYQIALTNLLALV